MRSDSQVLVVPVISSVTSLSALPAYSRTSGTGALCNGSVMANYPVRDAPVQILIDGQEGVNLTTAEDGTFGAFLPLSPGSHTLIAEFSSEDFPLSPSASEEVTIEIPSRLFDLPSPSTENPLVTWGIASLVLLLAGIVAVWYIRRGSIVLSPENEKQSAEAARIRTELEELIDRSMRELPTAGPERKAALETTIDTLLEQYAGVLKKQGWSETARTVYLTLAARIAASLSLRAYRSLTPREMSVACRSEAYGLTFDHFVGFYEKIRYAGSEAEQDRKGFFNRFAGIYEYLRSFALGSRKTRED